MAPADRRANQLVMIDGCHLASIQLVDDQLEGM